VLEELLETNKPPEKNFWSYAGMPRTEKGPMIGGTSDAGDIPHIVEMMKMFNPKTVLDVGAGCFGKNGYLLRQYVEHKFRKLYGTEYMHIRAIEAFYPNAEYLESLGIYNDVKQTLALDYFCSFGSTLQVDLITCTHVLEHHTIEEGWELLHLMWMAAKKGIILACPLGEYPHSDPKNPHQEHKSAWVPSEIADKYPITTPIITRNNVGVEEFLIGIPK
jgi:hypothetical protein